MLETPKRIRLPYSQASVSLTLLPAFREEACVSVATGQLTPDVSKELKLQPVERFGAAVRRRGHGSHSAVCLHAETVSTAAPAYAIILIHS